MVNVHSVPGYQIGTDSVCRWCALSVFLFNPIPATHAGITIYTVMSNVIAKTKEMIRVEALIEQARKEYKGTHFTRSQKYRALKSELDELTKLSESKPIKQVTDLSWAKAQKEYARIKDAHGLDSAIKWAESITNPEWNAVSQTVQVLHGHKVVQTQSDLRKEHETRAESLEAAFRSYKKKVDGKIVMVPGKIYSGVLDGVSFKISWKRKDLPATKPQAFVKIRKDDRIPVKSLSDAIEVIRAHKF